MSLYVPSSALEIVNTHAIACAGIAAVGTWIPLADKIGIGASWTTMILTLGDDAGINLDRGYARKVVASIGVGGIFYVVGSEVLSSLLAFTGLGGIAAAGVNSILTYIYTGRLGEFIAHQFNSESWDWHESAWALGQLALAHITHIPSADEFWEAADHLGFNRSDSAA